MKKQIGWMSAALAACTLLAAGGAPAFAADSGREHNYTILLKPRAIQILCGSRRWRPCALSRTANTA